MTDLPGLKLDLGEDIETLRSAVRDWVQNELAPRVGEIDRTDQFSMGAWREMGELGVPGITAAEEYGDANMGYLAHIVAMEEVSRASASVGLLYDVHSNSCVNQIHRNGTVAQRARYLPKLASGEWVGALVMSESNARSGVVSMELRAELKGNRYVLDGTKMWITNGPDCDALVVYAKTEPELGACGVIALIAEKGMKGFPVAQKLDKSDMCDSHTSELALGSVGVPMENILGQEDGGIKALMSGLDYERVVLSDGSIGITQACTDVVTPYIHNRKQSGQSIGEFQFVQDRMADTYTTLRVCHAYLCTVGKNLDSPGRGHVRQVCKDCTSVIPYTAEKATWMVGEVIQILGGNGYINEFPAGRLWRDVKLYEIGADISKIRRMLIGREPYAETI